MILKKLTENERLAVHYGYVWRYIYTIYHPDTSLAYLCFTEKVRGTKTEHSDVDTYGGRIHVYIFSRVRLFG